MSPIYRKPPAKKPALKKAVKPAVKGRAGVAAKKPIRKVVKKATAVKRPAKIMRIGTPKRPVAKVARPVTKVARPAAKVTREGLAAQLKEFKAARSGLEGRTNQDIINVIYKAADELKMPAWTLLATAKLEKLVDARTAPYSGPAISDLPGLTPDQKAVIQKVLSGYTRPA
jgi:hypothetical protein